MSSNKELKLAYGIAVVLLVVGVLSYTALSGEAPEEPLRIMYRGAAGGVLFNHQIHAYDYGFSCSDCHHHPEDAGEMLSCNACHTFPEGGQLPEACLECHGADEVDLTGVPNKTDAYHSQCIGCHEDSGAGPVECATCHIL